MKHTGKQLASSTKSGTKATTTRRSCTSIYTVNSLPHNPSQSPQSKLTKSAGLHPDESVAYLEGILLKHRTSPRPVYAITGTGHHSKNGKDKVGKAIRGFLNEWRYAFREFSVPGDRNNVGGILGIDPSSYDKSVAERPKEGEGGESGESGNLGGEEGRVRVLKREEVGDGTKGLKR